MWFGQWTGTTFTGQWWGDSGSTPAAVETPQGGSAKRRYRTRIRVDGQEFEVDSPQNAVVLMVRAREAAEEAAPVAVSKAKSRKRKPPVPPKLELLGESDGSLETQQLQAQVDATNAYIAQVYAYEWDRLDALAKLRGEEEEVVVLLTMGML